MGGKNEKFIFGPICVQVQSEYCIFWTWSIKGSLYDAFLTSKIKKHSVGDNTTTGDLWSYRLSKKVFFFSYLWPDIMYRTDGMYGILFLWGPRLFWPQNGTSDRGQKSLRPLEKSWFCAQGPFRIIEMAPFSDFQGLFRHIYSTGTYIVEITFLSVSDCWSFFVARSGYFLVRRGREEDGSGEEQTSVPLWWRSLRQRFHLHIHR